MKRRSIRAVGLVAITWMACAHAVAATAQQQRSPEEMQALAQKLMAAGEPGPEHERLAGLVGSWAVEMKVWPEPGAEPATVRGAVESKMVLGGRFLMQQMEISGGMFAGEALVIIGFDRRSSEYTIVGLDTTGTYWVTARGPASADGTRVVMSGTDYDPIFGFEQVYDMTLDFVDADTLVSAVIFKDAMHTRGGEPFKMVESTSRRR